MPTLWFDLDEIDDENDEEDFELLPEDNKADDLYDERCDDEESMDVICPICESVIEDGVQCEICGYLVEIYVTKKDMNK